ncbi:MAG: O-succinylhomoserine sulfhydrylase [bacterium]|nr:O-succinylhomoserine sulfhydrylase [bacterium]
MEQPPIEWRLPTRLVRGGLTRSPHSETSEALYLTSGYVYDTAEEAAAAFAEENPRYIYSRYGNPTVSMFEERLRMLEGAEACRATASGMAAVFAALASILKAGDRLVASRALFGSCLHVVAKILPPFGIETVLVDGTDIGQWRDALKGGARAVFLETPSNPTLEIIDLPQVCALAHEAGATVVVDNVFASPLLQKPLELGADIVVYSATKHIDGQGRCLGGAVLGPAKFVDGPLFTFLKHTGPALSPFNAWVLLKGLETLDLRMARHVASAEAVAGWLDARHGVRRMLYPWHPAHPQTELARRMMRGGGSVIAFEVEGGRQRAFRFLNALKLIDISNNLGDSKSLVTHPATTTHSKLSPEERKHLGITDGLVRLHVGLEDVADIEDDLAQALAD